MPKLVNLVSTLVNLSRAPDPLISVRTAFPASPTLFWSCIDPVRVNTPRKRFGSGVPHGLNQWVGRIDREDAPDVAVNNTFTWFRGPPCGGSGPCWFFIAQPQAIPPLVDWSTPPIACTPPSPPASAVTKTNVSNGYDIGEGWGPTFWTAWTNDNPPTGTNVAINFPITGSMASQCSVRCGSPNGPPNFHLRFLNPIGDSILESGDATPDGALTSSNSLSMPAIRCTSSLHAIILQLRTFTAGCTSMSGFWAGEWAPP